LYKEDERYRNSDNATEPYGDLRARGRVPELELEELRELE
jgi:hypothetical protein